MRGEGSHGGVARALHCTMIFIDLKAASPEQVCDGAQLRRVITVYKPPLARLVLAGQHLTCQVDLAACLLDNSCSANQQQTISIRVFGRATVVPWERREDVRDLL